MPERERMLRGQEIVTVLEVAGKGKNAKVTIRNKHGFVEEVKAGDLVPMNEGDKLKRYRFAGSDS